MKDLDVAAKKKQTHSPKMPIGETNIMSGIENTGAVKQHNHKKRLKQRFDIIKKLGQGTFGKVQLGINKETGQEVAIKIIKKSKIESEADLIRIRREIQIMSSVQHPNIIHIYEVFENKEKMVLVMEYAAGGELYDYLSKSKVLSEEEARRIFRQIATASYYCHKHKICHRDLKLENILLDENNNAKIADFGLSNVFDDQRLLKTFCGSPLYASPEIVKGTPYHGPEVDCWSLGVLLYTLVYGAMPFDGSNFKRLVRQISQGDYFEPATPSPASPLIREMLTVNPASRANIEKICNHWWVNETYDENCLDISEELANQTPVRLDVLLTLAPPAPQLECDKLVVTSDVTEDGAQPEPAAPTRSQSVGSLMELSHPAERRIHDLINEEKQSPKRKLESTVSTDRANLDKGVKRKDKIIKENTVADISVHGAIMEQEEAKATPLIKSTTQTISKDMDCEQTEATVDPSLEGAACAEIVKEAEMKEEVKKQPSKLKKTQSTSVSNKILEGINEAPSQENVSVTNNVVDKENVNDEPKAEEAEISSDNKVPAKRKVVKKKVLTDKNSNSKAKIPEEEAKSEPVKPIERRRSRIFEAAEKFQTLLSPTETKPTTQEKPKKIIIPGVSVDGFKKEFERKASLTSTSPPKLKAAVTKRLIDKQKSEDEPPNEPDEEKPVKKTEERQELVRNAVNIISSALDKEGTRKSKSRPCMMRKPPVPFGASGRSASGNIGMITSPVVNSLGPKPFVKANFEKPKATVEVKQVEDTPEPEAENQTSSAEITLKSATLPRRRTTKAEIQLNYPAPKATMEFKTEMAHNVDVPSNSNQRSEVVVPVKSPPIVGFRASSVEAEAKQSPKERIIPIAFEKPAAGVESNIQSPPAKPPMPRLFHSQKSNQSQRSNSLSRQSTQDSDTETVTSSGEPIRKSPREYIIPIAVEGGGYVTPRSGSVEPSDSTGSTMTNKSRSKFGVRGRRLNDSEDESPFSSLHRHSSFGKDSDTEDSRRDAFHMHRLRSSRPTKSHLEHNDSLSSGEEDDDEGFEILTAENLFSTLLSRVRDLTGGRPGFPSSRLLSHFDTGTNFWNRMDPLTRHSSIGRNFNQDRPTTTTSNVFGAPWRRSVSRDLASDIESVFSDSNPTTTTTTTRPRGDNKKSENLNLADLDLKKLKLSDEDALALSYLTPGLSRRIQKQLLAKLAPSEARKLHRTLSSQTPEDHLQESQKFSRRSVDRLSSTLPRRFSINNNSDEKVKSNLPVKAKEEFRPIRPHYEYSVRSSSIGAEPRGDTKFLYGKPSLIKSMSVREPSTSFLKSNRIISSPESSISESLSKNDDSSSYRKDTDSEVSNVKKARRISRFLRPDFFDPPKEPENTYMKEKKEREMETQKVLKEIRDKRKTRLNQRRESAAKLNEDHGKLKQILNKDKLESSKLLNNVSNSIKTLENNVQTINDYVNVPAEKSEETALVHDYVNVGAAEQLQPVKPKSKIARPKSYPATTESSNEITEKESKLSKLRKGFSRKPKEETSPPPAQSKNKLLQSIEKKLEKFKLNTSQAKDAEELKALQEKKSTVESAIKRLREQSVPKNFEHGTESNLIKRAVSVEDLTIANNKPLQASRKSVTKILGLFKKYEEDDNKKRMVKKTKVKERKTTKPDEESDTKTTESVILLNNNNNTTTNEKSIENQVNGNADECVPSDSSQSEEMKSKSERPRSLLFDKVKHFQNGTKCELNQQTKSKLPVVNSTFRRSLNLDHLPEPPKFYKNPSKSNINEQYKSDLSPSASSSTADNYNKKADRKGLKLDLSSSTLLSPSSGGADDYMSDSWSVSSDFHSPNGLIYSGDESESVIDRIRRKSFYTRFNEKKRPARRSNYNKDFDYNCGSLDRRSYDYTSRAPSVSRVNSYAGTNTSEYRPYTRSSSANLMGNDYVNVPNRYQTYSSRIGGRHSGNLYSDSEDNALDDLLLTARSRKFSPHIQQSKFRNKTSVSPANDLYLNNNQPTSPTTSEPLSNKY